jgi:hypothetical protein
VALALIPLVSLLVGVARAVPVFSRKYHTSCSTCHYAFPQLNAFGKAFQNHGYRYPGGDADLRKDDPVSLGSESYKKVWPDAIWPSDIPGFAPLAIRAQGSIEMPLHQPDSVAKSNFAFPEHVQLFYAGTLGEKFSFFGEVEIEDVGGTADVGFPFRLQLNQAPAFNVTVGSLHFDPSPGDFGLVPTEYNVSAFESRNGWTAGGEQPGIGIWGAGNGAKGKGGWKYNTAVVTSQGLSDAGRDKDYFARATYKIGGLGELGGTEGQASSSSAFYRDNNATIGGYIYSGHVAGNIFAEREELTTFAGTTDIWYGRAILNAVVLGMTSKIAGTPDRDSRVWYAQGQYVVYPWLIGMARYESTDEDSKDTAHPATMLIPAVAGMVRANVKMTLEYRRPISDYSLRKSFEEHLLLRFDFAM